ncbi:unnamed protein product [Ceutorhynchus assimilis]|uniref:Receptor expression-enhancing protein n=1 Tax=Ceutorhynchus assimilis TaxID=467358 RepID=A0A9P0DJW8_9CUCU|nr:unnamed protein product [Ceutorhynchus assimilis]
MIYKLTRLVFGTLYPAYSSYKAVKTKNVREYVKWMMYWIVFALFTCTETITDIFLSWFPFYYEIKIILVIWLLSPATKGSSILYRKFVHPMLSSREQEIDDYISKAREQSYRQVLDLGQKGVTVLMQTALRGGGGIVNQLKKSYSLSDLSDGNNVGNDEADDVLVSDPQFVRRRKPGRSPHRSSSASSASVYFSEVDVVAAELPADRVSVKSVEDISSGYSSGEGLYSAHNLPSKLQPRESISQRANSLTRSRSTRVTRSSVPKKTNAASDDSDENELFDTNIIFLNDKAKKIDKLFKNPEPNKHESSSSENEFFDIAENNGFQLHGKTFDNSERSCSNNSNVITSGKECSSTSILGYDCESKITACNIDNNSSSSLNFNLTKLSSSMFPSNNQTNEEGTTRKDTPLSMMKEADHKGTETPLTKKNSNLKLEFLASTTTNQEICPQRGGKYNKKHAPLPPLPPKRNNISATPIKATLVLQPGLVRSLESLNKDIFLNYSPKVRRRSRSRNRSPISTSSKSSNESTTSNKALINKMLRIPQRMAHLNLTEKVFSNSKKLLSNRSRSKSTSNLDTIEEIGKVEKPIERSGSQMSIKNLSESPHRRLKVIRRYVDNDAD